MTLCRWERNVPVLTVSRKCDVTYNSCLSTAKAISDILECVCSATRAGSLGHCYWVITPGLQMALEMVPNVFDGV